MVFCEKENDCFINKFFFEIYVMYGICSEFFVCEIVLYSFYLNNFGVLIKW